MCDEAFTFSPSLSFMPLLHQESIGAAGLWGIWQITEPVEALATVLVPNEPDRIYLESIAHPDRFHQTLASRVLAQVLLQQWGISYGGTAKDPLRKPYLVDCPYYISLSHTQGYAAVIIHKYRRVGIDIEHLKEKLNRVAPRVFTEAEQHSTRNDLLKTGVYWCAKEAIYKVSENEILSLRNIWLKDFQMQKKGTLFGQIQQEGSCVELEVFYCRMITFIVAYCIDTSSQL